MWTVKQIQAFKPKDKRYRVSDDLGQKGSGRLVLDVQPTGVKTFFYQYYNTRFFPSRRVLVKIGVFKQSAKSGGLSLSEAREKALELSGLLSECCDVKAHLSQEKGRFENEREEKRLTEMTLQEVFDAYLENKVLKPGTVNDYKRCMRESFEPYLNKPLSAVNRRVILNVYRLRSKVSVARANNAMRVFKAVYNYQRAVCRGQDDAYLLPENPVLVLNEAKVMKRLERRKTYIPKESLRVWFQGLNALCDDVYLSGLVVRDYFIFLILTGARRQEVLSLTRDDVDLKRRVFVLRETKNHQVVELPMSDYLTGVVQARLLSHHYHYVFACGADKPLVSLKRPLDYLRERVGFKFSPHDLRRTFITVAESLDISSYTIKRLVNHKISESADVTAGYMMIDLERMRVASEKVSRFFQRYM
ncbi:MAG: integrase family protein [Pseudomonadota bacterium]